MKYIRKASRSDASRLAEILVFTKRINYRPIFQNDDYSFGELQVIPVAQEYLDDPALLHSTYVYDDGIVRGLIQIRDKEIVKLYVDHFFQGQGIGEKLIEFAIQAFDVQYLYALEKNTGALRFYARHGFTFQGSWEYEEGTPERLLKLERGTVSPNPGTAPSPTSHK